MAWESYKQDQQYTAGSWSSKSAVVMLIVMFDVKRKDIPAGREKSLTEWKQAAPKSSTFFLTRKMGANFVQ